jgi:uncharacterized OB-fold protein
VAQVEGSLCRCGRAAAPPRRYCPDCQRAMVPAHFDAAGFIVTCTTEEVTPEGVDAPVHLAVVRLEGGAKGKTPVRVMARLEGPATTGQAVRLEPRGEVLWAVAH